MKPVAVLMMVFLLAGCASPEERPPTGPSKAEVKARDEFANSLPKPPER